MQDLKPTLEKLYPENFKGGECGIFAHKLISFPSVGDSLANKKAAVAKYGILAKNLKGDIRPGDVVITTEGTWLGFGHGHVAVANLSNDTAVFLTESNFNLDGRVHHTRMLRKDSPAIVGVIRGSFLFTPPQEPIWPIQIRVKILMNKQPFWNSLLQHMANLQTWFWQASGNKIQLVIDYKDTNFSYWDIEYVSDELGSSRGAIISKQWMLANIAPLAGNADTADILLFCMPRKDWKGTVFDHPELMEAGMAFTGGPAKKPYMAMLVTDEHDDYPPYYVGFGAFAKLAGHEICHLLYKVVCSDKFPAGTDLTHPHFYGQNDVYGKVINPVRPEDCFNDFDYTKIREIFKYK